MQTNKVNWLLSTILVLVGTSAHAVCSSNANENYYSLHDAIRTGDARDVKNALACTPIDINYGPGYMHSEPPLVAAIDRRSDAIFDVIMADPRIDINKQFSRSKSGEEEPGWTPLMVASEAGNNIRSALRLLADPRIEVNLQNSIGQTAFHMFLWLGGPDEGQMFKLGKSFLAKQEMDLNLTDIDHTSAIFYAAPGFLSPRFLKLLILDQRLDINSTDYDGNTVLMQLAAENAAHHDPTYLIEAILTRPELQINKRSKLGKTATQLARQAGRTQLVHLLEAHGGN
jgi:hypothetical protein